MFVKLSFRIFISFAFILYFSACKTPKDLSNKETQLQPKIAFFVFTVNKDSGSNNLNVILKDKIITEGKLKTQEEYTANSFPNALQLVFYNGKSMVKEIFIEHPLYKRVDVYQENGKIESKSFNLMKVDFSIRTGWTGDVNKLFIYEYINREKTKNVIKLLI